MVKLPKKSRMKFDWEICQFKLLKFDWDGNKLFPSIKMTKM